MNTNWTKFEDDLLRRALRDPMTRFYDVVHMFDNRSMGAIAKRATKIEGIPPRTKILLGRGSTTEQAHDWATVRKQAHSRDDRFAEAMRGRRFDDARVPSERRMQIPQPSQHIPREANS